MLLLLLYQGAFMQAGQVLAWINFNYRKKKEDITKDDILHQTLLKCMNKEKVDDHYLQEWDFAVEKKSGSSFPKLINSFNFERIP